MEVEIEFKFSPLIFGEALKKKYRFITHLQSEEIFVYVDGVYEPFGEQLIRAEARQMLGEEATETRVNEIVAHIRETTYIQPNVFNSPPPNLICVQNGILDIESLTLIPHTHDLIFLNKIPVAWDPQADCPKIKKFLEEVIPDERDRKAFLEYVGYCLYRKMPFHKALMLVGEGENGKSTAINLVKALLGEKNVVSRSLQELCQDRFALADLYGKLANLFYDLPTEALRTTGPFKALVGGDLIKGERKFKQPFFFVNHAKLIFSANQLPKTLDYSDAFFRRWIIITFPNKFTDKRDPHILEKLTTPQELSGFLKLAVEHLKELLSRGTFANEECVEKIKDMYIRMSDPVGAFVADCILPNPEFAVEKALLYRLFCEYCRKNKYVPFSDKTFFRRLQEHVQYFEERIRSEEGERKRIIVGITLSNCTIMRTEQHERFAIITEAKYAPEAMKIACTEPIIERILNKLVSAFGLNNPFDPERLIDLLSDEEFRHLPQLLELGKQQGWLMQTPDGLLMLIGKGMS